MSLKAVRIILQVPQPVSLTAFFVQYEWETKEKIFSLFVRRLQLLYCIFLKIFQTQIIYLLTPCGHQWERKISWLNQSNFFVEFCRPIICCLIWQPAGIHICAALNTSLILKTTHLKNKIHFEGFFFVIYYSYIPPLLFL